MTFSLTKKLLESKPLFHKVLSLCLCLLFFILSLGTPTAEALVKTKPSAPKSALLPANINDLTVKQIINALPKGDRWLQHLNEDLLPFWTTPEATGEATGEIGNFPTYRCNDGSLYKPATPCPELQTPSVPGIVKLERDYVRSKSRQTFAYGVAYNLTGEQRYLELARAGVEFLRDNALDPKGGAYTYFDQTTRAPEPDQIKRISQDMTYALSGMAFYYYLTRDASVLRDIVKVKDYIFETYYDKEWDLIAWANSSYLDYTNPTGQQEFVDSDQRELVSQLDQVYAYMILLTPILPAELDGKTLKSAWENDLVHLATIMSEQFYTPDENIFWGAITSSDIKRLGTDHTDFGHSIKTLWLIYEIGKMTGHYDLVLFAQEAAPKILQAAYLTDGSWGRRFNINDSGQRELQTEKEWWILAELDQVSATFSLRDPSYAKYLTTTYPYWFNTMVDKTNHEIWHWVDSDGTPDLKFPKQHSWKNAFHSFEHAIVGYLTAQEIHNEPSTLYFAFEGNIPDRLQIRPYIYAAKVESIVDETPAVIPTDGTTVFRKQKVTFSGIR